MRWVPKWFRRKPKKSVESIVDAACDKLKKDMIARMKAANTSFCRMRSDICVEIEKLSGQISSVQNQLNGLGRTVATHCEQERKQVVDWGGFEPEKIAKMCRMWNDRLTKLEKRLSPVLAKKKKKAAIVMSKEDLEIINNPRYRHMENTNGTSI